MTHSDESRSDVYRDLLEVCGTPVYALDERGVVVYVNAAIGHLTGYAHGELLGRSLAVLTGEQPLQRLLREFNDADAEGPWRRTVELLHRDRITRFNAVVRWTRVRAGPGGAAIAGSMEVAEFGAGDPAACALGNLLRDNPYPMMWLTRDGGMTYANSAAGVILDFWGAAADGRLPEDICNMLADIREPHDHQQLDLKCGGRIYTMTFVPSPDMQFVNVHGVDITDRGQAEQELMDAYEGLEARVAERTAEIKNANDRLVSEVRERKRIEEELREINQKLKEAQNQLLQSEKLASVGQLAAGVAHEINNPVGYIKSNLGTLKQYVEDLVRVLDMYESMDPLLQADAQAMDRLRELKEQVELDYLKNDLKDLLAESEEGVERVKQIVQDLKDFSHVNEAEWQWADIHKGLESTLNIVRNEIKYKCEVVKEYGELPRVECIPSQLNQVFTNLLVNASQAVERHGVITIRTGYDEEQGLVRIEVCDTGQGIAPEHVKRIFDPFFTTKPVGMGTGLGLSLSYGIIRSHNGRIEVESTAGQGTAFTIWLPVAQSEARADKQASGDTVLESVFEG